MGCSQSKAQTIKNTSRAAPQPPTATAAPVVIATAQVTRNDSLCTAPSPTHATKTFVSDSNRIQDNIALLLANLPKAEPAPKEETALFPAEAVEAETFAPAIHSPVDSVTVTEPAVPCDTCCVAAAPQLAPATQGKAKKNRGNRKQKRVDADAPVKVASPTRAALQPTTEAINVPIAKPKVTFTAVAEEERADSPNKRRKSEPNRGKGGKATTGLDAMPHGKNAKAKVKAPKFRTTTNIRQEVYASQLAAFQRLLTDVNTLDTQLSTN